MPVPGHVAGLITDGVQAAQVGEAAVVSRGVDFVGASGSGRKRFGSCMESCHVRC